MIRAYETDGPPNAETHVELLEHRAGLGRYRLRPATGRTHQLRLHMSGLGVPILGDDLYPEIRGAGARRLPRAACSCSPRSSRSPIRSPARRTGSGACARSPPGPRWTINLLTCRSPTRPCQEKHCAMLKRP